MERIVALVIGVFAICFGLMLLPYADALRRRMVARRQPLWGGFRLLDGLPRTSRNHVLPMVFVAFGVVLVGFAIFGGA